ncbi:MAG TPA: hypothetical protein PLL69_10715, partial [Gemmatimonadales bacterium]|nr:hypothetical protein [Gemmatimonadales bacterium]
MRNHFRLPMLGASFVLAGVACGAAESGAGDSIEALPVEQVLEFSTDSDSGPAIRWISDAAILGDGRVSLLDGSSQAIHILEPSGSLFRSIERPGEGPGEFRRPTWIRS